VFSLGCYLEVAQLADAPPYRLGPVEVHAAVGALLAPYALTGAQRLRAP
jgi:hypothetical protein